jgi:hypothetical protein
MKGYIKYRDEGGIEAIDFVRDLPNTIAINQMLGLATHLHGLSNAGIVEYGLIAYQSYAPPAGALVAGANVHNKGRCHFTYQSATSETKTLSLWIPAPMMNNYTFVQGVGYRMTAAAGAILQAALRNLTLITDLQFSIGVLDYRESASHSHSESAIQYKDSAGNTCWMNLPQPVSVGAMETFNGIINGFSMCTCVEAVYAEPTVVVVPDTDELASKTNDDLGFDTVETRAIMKFRYVAGTRKKTMSLTLPAIKTSSVVSEVDSDGYKVIEVIGQGVALAITALYGAGVRAPVFKSSKVDVKNLKTQ